MRTEALVFYVCKLLLGQIVVAIIPTRCLRGIHCYSAVNQPSINQYKGNVPQSSVGIEQIVSIFVRG